MQTATSSNTVSALNTLLRGELAATETYQQALAKVGDQPGVEDLRKIHVEHREAANQLRQYVHHFGGQPDQGSGAWGAFAKAIEGTAKVFGKTAALKALKEGEELGLNSYDNALQNAELPAECKWLINSQLVPQTKAHITMLDRLMEKS